MDAVFLEEIRTAREVKMLPARIRRVAGLDLHDPHRMGVLAEMMQTWIAIAAAASRESGLDGKSSLEVLSIAQKGAIATKEAMLEGGSAPVMLAAGALKAFLQSPPFTAPK